MGGERPEDLGARVQQRAVSLWDVLTVLSGASAFGGAMGAASFTHVSGLRLVAAVAWSMLIGFASIACIRVCGGRLLDRASPGAVPLVYAGAVVWIFGAIVLAATLTRGLLALLG